MFEKRHQKSPAFHFIFIICPCDNLRHGAKDNANNPDDLPTTPKPNGTILQNTRLHTLTPKLVPIQVIIFASYPITVLLGILSNHPPESYFSRKDNIINVLFLKFAWGWTTIAFFIHVARVPQKVAPLARYMVATCVVVSRYSVVFWSSYHGQGLLFELLG